MDNLTYLVAPLSDTTAVGLVVLNGKKTIAAYAFTAVGANELQRITRHDLQAVHRYAQHAEELPPTLLEAIHASREWFAAHG